MTVQIWTVVVTWCSVVSSLRLLNSTSDSSGRVLPSAGPWPQAFILGGQKCASTSLWTALERHPKLCRADPPNSLLGDEPWYDEKEIHFLDVSHRYDKGPEWYLRHFGHDPTCHGGKYMDATPGYIHSPGSAGRLFNVLPQALRKVVRFVLILREPVARDLSRYNHVAACPPAEKYPGSCFRGSYWQYVEPDLKDGNAPLTGHLRWGVYHVLLTDWLQSFARSQFFILNFMTMIKEQEQSISQIASFFGVGAEPLRGVTLPHENQQASAKKVSMESVSCEVRASLSTLFAPHNEILYRMLENSHATGAAPPEEPEFEKFASVTCS